MMAGILQYPQNIQNIGIPFVLISFWSRVGGTRSASTTPNIVLFMPPAFQITDGHDYEFAEKGVLGQIINTASGDVVQGSVLNIARLIGEKIFNGIFAKDVAQAAAAAGTAVRDPKFFNYKEPKAREFTFNYKFEPKNRQDASSMMEIINALRVSSYPSALPGGRVYGVPDEVSLTFKNVKTGLEGVVTDLVIKEVNTTLSEGEQMLTLDTSEIPTQVSLQIQFAETTLLTREGDTLVRDQYGQPGIP
jgi:hypothetical protein